MPHSILSTEDFISGARQQGAVIIDARSESEFAHGHIPGAVNIPLLNDNERKVIGTAYKQQGKDAALLKGFEQVGPRFYDIITNALEAAPGKDVMLYCWRGGMRSNITSWLLSTSGFNVKTLTGGYKSYRRWAQAILEVPVNLIVLGGKTGSGKTKLLKALREKGEQVLDLEAIACHKGSAFGALGQPPQPTNEQFENLIADQWSRFDKNRLVWIENESRSIGSNIIPDRIYTAMRNANLVEVIIPDEVRKENIRVEYGCFPAETLIAMTDKIRKRLGPQHHKNACTLLTGGDFNGWLEIILDYYDRLYDYGNQQRNPESILKVKYENDSAGAFADKLIRAANSELQGTVKD